MAPTDRPRFTIVSAVYDVSRFLPDFIASIEGQDFDLGRVEVVMVDDGSHDDSLAVLEAWAARRPELVRVVSQANAGQGAARNAGLGLARGEWVTFPDPDDVVDPNYLSAVDGFITANPTVEMVATNRLIWAEITGVIANTHPLHRFFAYDRLADLDVTETSFHGSAPAAFFKVDQLVERGIAFDDRIRPNFEDGHFCSRYLLHCEKPLVGFLRSTAYHYRKRADQSSSLQGSMLHPGRYTDVFEFGYRGIIAEAQRLRGHVPRWLQHFLAYELTGYLSAYERGRVPVITEGPETAAFHDHVRAIVGELDLAAVLPFSETPISAHLRHALEHGYDDRPWHQDRVRVDHYDPAQRLARVRYFHTGDAPAEEIWNGERPVGPRHAKTRDLTYFGRTLLRERVLWVRYVPDLRVRLDGAWVPIDFDRDAGELTRALPLRIRRFTQPLGRPSRQERRRVAALSPEPTTPLGRKAQALAAKPRTAQRYAEAWVLMDRIHNAGDSAEVLFRHLRAEHPGINAYFVIEDGTADHKRLRAEFGKRVVAHGSLEWRALMAHCAHLLSSHADVPIMRPSEITEFCDPAWKFTFLQHGVIKDDLNSWLGRKFIDVFVTSTTAEHASIAGEGTAYPFTTKEVKLTGLPRFDRLREIGARYPAGERDLLLVTPTWRQWLVEHLGEGTQRRTVDDAVLGSEFVRSWVELLSAPELEAACREHDLTLGFLPHPNLEALLPQLDLPAHVTPLTYDGVDVQEYFARARLLVTDYSSIAFNAAYLDRPVVYFQFDARTVLETGGHVGRGGYFSYERDGFGAVTADAPAALEAINAALAAGPGPAPEYQRRIDAAFPQRDGRCSERVVQAVLALGKPDKGRGQVPTP
ncbi:MAG: CDP-glycerol glycerophosphotransferase family protein [Marmoricola sp.]